MPLVKLNVDVIKLNDLSKLNLVRSTYRCLTKNLLSPPQTRRKIVFELHFNCKIRGLLECALPHCTTHVLAFALNSIFWRLENSIFYSTQTPSNQQKQGYLTARDETEKLFTWSATTLSVISCVTFEVTMRKSHDPSHDPHHKHKTRSWLESWTCKNYIIHKPPKM